MVTAEGTMDALCPACDTRMMLERGSYVCPECGYAPDDEDDGPRTVDDLEW